MRTQRSGAAVIFGRTTAVTVALVATLLIGCGGGDDPLADTESIDSSSPEAGDGSQGGDAVDAGNGTDDNDDDSGDGGSDGTGEVLGTARATLRANAIDNRSTPIRIDVVRLERHGDLVELGLVLTNEAEAPPEGQDPQDFQLDSMFGGGPGVSARYDASGIALVDGDAQKLYLPVLDSADTCLCTSGLGAVDTPPGGTLTLDATYGGVPDDIESLDVRIPNFPVVTGVPLS